MDHDLIQRLETLIQDPIDGEKYDHIWPDILKEINDSLYYENIT